MCVREGSPEEMASELQEMQEVGAGGREQKQSELIVFAKVPRQGRHSI